MNLTQDRRRVLCALLTAAALGPAAIPRAWAQDDDGGPENLFISPCGQPFRAAASAPYPVATWFQQADADHDGRLTRAEFVADADAFFKVLDADGDGLLRDDEIAQYERVIAPEILGGRYSAGAQDRSAVPIGRDGGRLGLAQPLPQDLPIKEDPQINDSDDSKKPNPRLEAIEQGAAPYSLFNDAEPVMAADLNFDGLITKANFLRVADQHFTTLDVHAAGYLTLAQLPKTQVQRRLKK